jgi:tetratricopeptide (TPR) repeat protein
MQRKFDDIRDDFMVALSNKNWNDVAVYGTDLLVLDENLPWVWANRGVALHQLGFNLDAILNFDRALALEETAPAYNNKGAALFDLDKMQRSLDCYKKAADIDQIAETFMNIGHVHKRMGDNTKAIIAYRKSIEIDPNYADGHLALSLALLKAGHLQEGWKEFEWRWKTDQLVERKLKKYQWKGEDLTNKSILIYGEQGFGDVIQFARYVRIVAQRFPRAKIIVETKQPVKRLLETIPEVYAVINFGEKVPEVDYIIPMMSLPNLFTPTISSISSSEREFYVKRDDVEAWDTRLQPLYEKCQNAVLKVGICWAGMGRTGQPLAMKIDNLRSVTLDAFSPLAKIPGIAWISLQKGAPASQIQKPPSGMTIGDFTEDMYDFYETACAIENCDLVISVDTAVVHVAASIGKPTWMLSRWDGCWRWFGDREDSPWYPSLRQFVQPAAHDWDGLMANVAVELKKLVQSKGQQELDLTLAK